MVGNGTSPTSATASLSGASQNSLNSESGISSGTGGGCGGGGRGSPRLKMVETLLAAGKRETAIDMIVPNTQQQPHYTRCLASFATFLKFVFEQSLSHTADTVLHQ